MLFANVFSLAPNTQCYITASSCYVYSEASFSSEKITKDEELVKLSHKQVVTVQSEVGDFCLIKTQDEEIEGYVYKYYITNLSSQSVYPVFNAQTRCDTAIYDTDKNKTEYVAVKNQRIYLYEGFKYKEQYCAVQIVLSDGSLYNGYILTKDIKPDGISKTLIIAISAISAVVTIVLAIVFIKKPKKKKKLA